MAIDEASGRQSVIDAFEPLVRRVRQVRGRGRDFITIAGYSSVGKKTIIRQLYAGELDDRFGIRGSRDAYGWAFIPLEEIFEATADHVIYQWQVANDRLIEQLMERYPRAVHRVVVLWRPWDLHLRDLIADYGHTLAVPPNERNLIDEWQRLIVPRFRYELPARGVPVELVDASTPDYESTSWDAINKLI